MRSNHADYVTIFYYGTFLPVSNGGNTRLVEMLDRLHDEFERIILYCYGNHPHAPWTGEARDVFAERWPRIELVVERYGFPLRLLTRMKNLVIALSPKSAARMIGTVIPGATPRFEDVKQRSGIVVLSYTEALTQVNGVDPADCIVETHDVNFVKWSKIHQRSPYSLAALRKFRGEMALLETAGTILAISPVEYSFFRMMLRTPSITYVPTWSAPAKAARNAGRKADYDLVFVGSDYVMNIRGVLDLLAAHGSWLRRYRVALCGRVCLDAKVQAAAAAFPNISLLGFVESVDDLYGRSRAALSPVDGTGTKMKVLQALAAGLPVFASRQSRDGLPAGSEGAVFDVEEAQAAAVLDDDVRFREAGRAAERYHAVVNGAGDVDNILATMRARVPANRRPQPASAGYKTRAAG